MMESVLVVLIFLSLSGLPRRHVAALPASTVQVRVGEAATLQCPLLNVTNASSTLSWYKKAEGQSPELLLSFRSADTSKVRYGPGVAPDKVSAAADGSLLLHDSEQSDSAVYFCGMTQGGEQKKKPMPLEHTGK
ncbi:T cell receptor alpha variable 13-1 [Cottoperca gobio]|uniref:T cell receptor alpha variable 13-1 n=1 Tax=Cottoperca gobio TaxID=56716 RepID=UPI003F4A1363